MGDTVEKREKRKVKKLNHIAEPALGFKEKL